MRYQNETNADSERIEYLDEEYTVDFLYPENDEERADEFLKDLREKVQELAEYHGVLIK